MIFKIKYDSIKEIGKRACENMINLDNYIDIIHMKLSYLTHFMLSQNIQKTNYFKTLYHIKWYKIINTILKDIL